MRAFLLPLAAALAVGLVTIDGGFVFDDQSAVRRNPVVQGEDRDGEPVAWTEAFTRDFWGNEVGTHGVSWRPAMPLLWRGLWRIGGGSPLPFRIVNLLLHLACTAVVMLLARRVLGDGPTASLTALIFAVHPLHAEVVGAIVSHADLLAFALGGAAFWLVLDAPGRLGRSLAAAGVLALGCLAKETAFLFGPLAVATFLARHDVPRRAGLVAAFPMLAVSVAVVAAQLAIPRPTLPLAFDNLAGAASGLTEPLHALYIIGRAFGLCFVPTGLAPHHGYAAIDLETATLLPYAIPGLLLTLASLAAALWGIGTGRWPVVIASGLMLGTVLLQANLLFSSPTDLAERLLYPATAASSALLATLLVRGLGERAIVRHAASGALVVAFGASTWQAQRPWHDELALWARADEAEPRAWRSQRNYGIVLNTAGRTDESAWHWMLVTYIEAGAGDGYREVDWAPVEALERLPVTARLVEGPDLLRGSKPPCEFAFGFIKTYLGRAQWGEAWPIYQRRYGCGALPR